MGRGTKIMRVLTRPKGFRELRVGDYYNHNYLRIEKNGAIKLYGTCTCWDDLVGNLAGRMLSSTAGNVDYNWDNNSITCSSGGSISTTADRIISNLQYPHGAKEDGGFWFHLHYEQPDDSAYEFTMQYRIQSNGSLKTTDWTTLTATSGTDDIFEYPGSGTFNNILAFPVIDMTDKGISATIEYRLARTDSEIGDIEVTFFDAHVEYDMFGSSDQYIK